MYAVTSIWLVSRTRAILRSAEFGFLGVIVRTWMHTPRLKGDPLLVTRRPFRVLKLKRSAGAVVFLRSFARPFRTSWLIVGNVHSLQSGNKHRNLSIRALFRARQTRHAACRLSRGGPSSAVRKVRAEDGPGASDWEYA